MALLRDTRHKLEIELAEHIKKAVNSVETAPKQKHVRCMSAASICMSRLHSVCVGLPDERAVLDVAQVAADSVGPGAVLQGSYHGPQAVCRRAAYCSLGVAERAPVPRELLASPRLLGFR